jgi:hypothetical protein
MQFKMALSNCNYWKARGVATEKVRVTRIRGNQVARLQGSIPGGDKEAVTGNILQEAERVEMQIGIKQQFGVIEANAGIGVVGDNVPDRFLRLKSALAPGETQEPLAHGRPQIDEWQIDGLGHAAQRCCFSCSGWPDDDDKFVKCVLRGANVFG